MENMFLDWLTSVNAEVEAMIFKSPKDWCGDQYIFRFRKDGGEWSGPSILPWGIDTFVKAQEIIGGQG